ncbi:hypothetical protein WJX72_011882 [[Myrmecia] bisecta]|uniref:EF-hand domain-containing protein n=1 Tax=[Myrmecia] bisecta TaxID=41462 RepID=A0AAW1QGN1_9CHLO
MTATYQEIFGHGLQEQSSLGPDMKPLLNRVTVPQAERENKLRTMRSDWESLDMAGGGAASKAAEIFRRYDRNNDGRIDMKEMVQAMRELGVLDGFKPKQAGRVLQAEFKQADLDKDGLITFQEFTSYFKKLALFQQQEARAGRLAAGRLKEVPSGWEQNSTLKKCFRNFCQFGKSHAIGVGGTQQALGVLRMNNWQYAHLCKDAGLVEPEGNLSATTIDVIFANCKPTGERHLAYRSWLDSLAMLAEEAGLTFETVAGKLGARPGMLSVPAPATAAAADDEPFKLPKPKVSSPSKVALAWKKPKKRSAAAKRKAGGGKALTPSEAMYRAFSMMDGSMPQGDSDSDQDLGPRRSVAAAIPTESLEELLHKAREQAMEEANRKWAAKSKQLLTRIHMLEDRLSTGEQAVPSHDNSEAASPLNSRSTSLEQPASQRVAFKGEAVSAAAAAAPSAQLSQPPPPSSARQIPVPEGAGLWVQRLVGDIQAQVEGLAGDLVSGLDRQLRGLEGRLQAAEQAQSHAAEARNQELAVRLASLEGQVASLRSSRSSQAGGEVVEQLNGRVRALSATVSGLASQVEEQRRDKTSYEVDTVVRSVEKRVVERQSRLEGALMQVAARVDLLDRSLKQEQQSSLRALEAILAESKEAKSAGAPAAAAAAPAAGTQPHAGAQRGAWRGTAGKA